MKDLELLKKEQYDLKAKLHELIEFMNGEEFFTLNESRRKMYNNLKISLEMHLKCLSTMTYENLDNSIVNIPDFTWIGTMMGMFVPSFNIPKVDLKESDFETNQEDSE